ncbi:hypothetical protein SAMN03159424_04356 [Pseudomonas sp. NFACC05-1]|nr:hypothetical protein SAMN03159424_04356 [Pseudomonas sp. NFACC05-1]
MYFQHAAGDPPAPEKWITPSTSFTAVIPAKTATAIEAALPLLTSALIGPVIVKAAAFTIAFANPIPLASGATVHESSVAPAPRSARTVPIGPEPFSAMNSVRDGFSSVAASQRRWSSRFTGEVEWLAALVASSFLHRWSMTPSSMVALRSCIFCVMEGCILVSPYRNHALLREN